MWHVIGISIVLCILHIDSDSFRQWENHVFFASFETLSHHEFAIRLWTFISQFSENDSKVQNSNFSNHSPKSIFIYIKKPKYRINANLFLCGFENFFSMKFSNEKILNIGCEFLWIRDRVSIPKEDHQARNLSDKVTATIKVEIGWNYRRVSLCNFDVTVGRYTCPTDSCSPLLFFTNI